MKKYYNFISLFTVISLYMIAMTLYVVAGEFKEVVFALFSAAVISSLIYIIWKRREIKTLIQSTFFKNAFSNVITLILVFFILGMVNYLIARQDHLFDFTKAKIHSLSDQSKKVLSQLNKSPLKMTLFSKREDWSRYLNLLKLYEKASPEVSLHAVDVDKEPALVELHQIKQNGTLLVEYEGKIFKAEIKDELGITNLLAKILRPQKMFFYSIVGHNQLDLESEKPGGASKLRQMIMGANYELKSLDLSESKIPADAAGIILLNPQTAFLQREIDELKHYILKGGSIVITLAPQFSEFRLTGLENLLKELGVEFINGIILDRLSEGHGGQASIPIVNQYPQKHPITKNFEGRTIFPVSAFFKVKHNKLYDWEIIAKSTPFPASWGEVSFDEVKKGKASYLENKDHKGPLSIMLAGESSGGRVLLYSSSSFITNQFQGQTNNFNLFLNSLNWLVGEESLVSLDRPDLEGNLIYISDIHLTMVFYFVIICFPFVFFGIAIFAYRVKLGR